MVAPVVPEVLEVTHNSGIVLKMLSLKLQQFITHRGQLY